VLFVKKNDIMATVQKNDAKEIFKNCGTCSRTFAHILNREFGHINEAEESALNPLAGGIMNLGHQCGMLWGAPLAIGGEAYRKYENTDQATAIAIKATQEIIESFKRQTNTTDCKEIIGYDLTSVFGMARFMLKVTLQGMNNSHCFNLAEEWAPEAIHVASKTLSQEKYKQVNATISCASEVLKKMGGSAKESIMVAGFAGGLGLSGNACGALSAAIWKKMLDWSRENPDKDPPFFNNKIAKQLVKDFHLETSNEITCSEICGKQFRTIEEHTNYIKNGGCEKIISTISNT